MARMTKMMLNDEYGEVGPIVGKETNQVIRA